LNKIVGKQLEKGVSSTKEQTLFSSINQKVDLLKCNPQYGVHIAKNKIPKNYVLNYDVNNLWKCNLSGAWRMIYTLKGTEVEIFAIVLDIFSHKKYEKKFNYKKS
jgi:hypothetical protein